MIILETVTSVAPVGFEFVDSKARRLDHYGLFNKHSDGLAGVVLSLWMVMWITEIIYDSLTSLNNTNKHYKEENEELNVDLNVELSSFIDFILENDESKKENLDSSISQQVISFISDNNGYS
ncbi:24690_t:CDS:2 [Cetraspora pellucida]|uniref:24690_t:CDS:1 n=1 Tax=Cetraspora pellucida TaxID=1433469 RepID=A0A9N9JW37_9GLOM|nr:24690_t:CDS:2 [Cetraspora pellucida]